MVPRHSPKHDTHHYIHATLDFEEVKPFKLWIIFPNETTIVNLISFTSVLHDARTSFLNNRFLVIKSNIYIFVNFICFLKSPHEQSTNKVLYCYTISIFF